MPKATFRCCRCRHHWKEGKRVPEFCPHCGRDGSGGTIFALTKLEMPPANYRPGRSVTPGKTT